MTKLESSTSQRQTKITYKINSGMDGNLMPFKIFKCLSPKATIELLHASKNNSVVLKTCNSSDIEQLGVFSVWLNYKDKGVKCRFFVVLASTAKDVKYQAAGIT